MDAQRAFNNLDPVRQDSAPDEADPPRWRVTWQDWSGHHDWVGKGRTRGGLPTKKKYPVTQTLEFATKEQARDFSDELVKVCGRENVIFEIADLRKPPPPSLTQERLPGEWPYQRSPVRLC